MKVTRQRKILIVLLGIGMCAMVADRLRAGSQNDAEPATAQPTVSAPPAALVTKSASNAESAASNSRLSSRVRMVVDQSPLPANTRDVFRVAPAWSGIDLTPTKSPVTSQSNQVARPFEHSHRLTGVIVAGRRGSAIVDGQMLMIGQSIDGYRLVTVTQGLATFESSDQRVVLRLDSMGEQPR